MDSTKNILTSNFMIMIYSAAFAGLTAFAMWDVRNIITEYIVDNRVTLVRLRNSTLDGFPFLGKRSSFCIWYKTPPLPTQLSADIFSSLYSQWLSREEIQWPVNMSESERADQIDYFTSNTYDMFLKLNDKGYAPIMEWSKNFHINESQLSLLFDRFINFSDNIHDLKRSALKIQQNFIQHKDKQLNINLIMPLQIHNFNTAPIYATFGCFLVPLAKDFTLTRSSSVQYDFDFIYLNNKTDLDQIGKNRAHLVQLYLPEKYIDFFANLDEDIYEQHTISIANNGVFDSSNFPPCTNFENEGDCLEDIHRKAIMEICKCIQLRQIFEEEALSTNHTIINYDRPICNTQIYGNCWERANETSVRRQEEAKHKKGCVPCTSAKRNYAISTSKLEWNVENFEYPFWFPRKSITFECTDTKFLLYEERPQFTLSQLISQVGGDLGLYIGFSMISILQLIMFLYHVRQKRKENKESNQPHRWANWFRSVKHYVIKSFTETRRLDEVQKQVSELQQYFLEVKQNVMTINLKLDALFLKNTRD